MENGLNFKVARLHRLNSDGKVKAFVDIAVNEAIILKGLKVLNGVNGLFVSMPQKKSTDNKYYDTISTLTPEVKNDISSAVMDAYAGN